MKCSKYIFFIALLFFSQKSQSQNLHWTMFDLSPLTLNPAFTGDYEGSFRVGANYRSQWNSISDATGFSTPSLYIDAPIVMIGNRGWLGVGGVLYNDEAGGNTLNTFSAMGSVAMHFGINKKLTSVLSFGIQGGIVQHQLKTDNILLEEQIVLGGQNLPFNNDMNGGLLNDPNNSFFDINIGVRYYSQLSTRSNLTFGLTVRNLLAPEKNLLSNVTGDNLPPLVAVHGLFQIGMNETWSLHPAFIAQNQASASEVGLQTLIGYRIDKEKNISIRVGPGYRVLDNDAIEAIFQLDYQGFRIGGAYDFNISDLSAATNNQGGFELSLSYIGKIYKKPSVKPVIFCPQF